MIQAVVFDVFGTLLQIGERRHPFRQLMQNLRLQGKTPRPDDARTLMTRNLGLAGAADYFGAQLSNSELASLESDLFTDHCDSGGFAAKLFDHLTIDCRLRLYCPNLKAPSVNIERRQ